MKTTAVFQLMLGFSFEFTGYLDQPLPLECHSGALLFYGNFSAASVGLQKGKQVNCH